MALADLKEERVRGRVSPWLLAACALIGTAASFAVLAARHERLEAVERCHVQLDVIADIRSAAIEHWVADGFGDARAIAGFPAVATLAAARSTGPPTPSSGKASRAQLEGVLASVVKNHGFLNAVVLAPDGRILVGAGERLQLDRACLDLTGRSQATRRPEVDFHPHGGAKLVVQFAAPVFTDQAAAPVAVVLLTSDPEGWLYPFLRHQPVPSETGETLLVRKDGDDVLYLGPLRRSVNPPLALRRSLLTPGLAAAAALQEREVFSEYTDYAGQRVFAVTRALAGTPWAMIVKVERAEMLRDYLRELAGTVAILTGIVLALAGVGYGAWHRQRHLGRLALARSEARVASLLDQGSDAVLFIGRNGVISEANARACEMFGHSRSEMVGMNVAELESRGLDGEMAARLADITGRQTAVFDTRHVRKDDSEFSGEISARVVEEAGQTWTVAVIRDVTERKRAEEQLRQALSWQEGIFEGSRDAIFISDFQSRFTAVNGAACELTGWSRDELLRMRIPDLHEDVDLHAYETFHDRILAGEEIVSEAKIRRKDGTKVDTEFNNRRVVVGGTSYVHTVARNVSERKRAEEALHESEDRYRDLVDQSKDLICTHDLAGRLMSVNPAAARVSGYSMDELLAMNFRDVLAPEVTDQFDAYLARVRDEGAAKGFIRVMTKSGERRIWEYDNTLRTEGVPAPVVRGLARDVTDRIQAERSLRQSEERYRNILHSIVEGYFEVDIRGNMTFCNDSMAKLLGRAREELIGLNNRAYMNEANAARVYQTFNRVYRTGEPAEAFDWELIRTDGVRVVVETSVALLRDAGGRPVGFRGLLRDITERKRVDETLQRSEARFRTLIEEAPVAILVWRDGTTLYANSRLSKMYGFAGPEEAVGRPTEEYFAPQNREEARERSRRRALGFIVPVEFESVGLRISGKQFPIHVAVANVILVDGPAYVAFVTDITERRRAEVEREELVAEVRALSAYLSTIGEELRARIARELHDRIGQNLAAIGLDLEIAHSRLPAEALGAAGARLDDAGRIVEQMVNDVRDLMAELRPPMLDEIGLLAALRWYGQQFTVRTGIAFEIEAGDFLPRLALGTEIALFRIVQEALTNVAAHAHAQSVSARFSVAKDRVALVIEDDGGGFDMHGQTGLGARPSWGLLGMRERAEAVGGTTRVESALGAGTRVIIEVPR